MGTRNLTCVVKDGTFRIAQYGQWDGYPSGQGQTIVNFLLGVNANWRKRLRKARGQHARDLDLDLDESVGYVKCEADRKRFRAQVDKIRHLTPDEVQARWADVGAVGEWVSMDIAAKFKEKHPQLDRDTGAGVLAYVFKAKKPEVSLYTQFAGESLFCEWAYVLDLDRDVLEIYKGFNKQKDLKKCGRFANFNDGTAEYRPVRKIVEIPFKDLALDTMSKIARRFAR